MGKQSPAEPKRRSQVRAHIRMAKGKVTLVKRHSREVEGPRSKVFKPIPEAKDVVWDFVIQEHKAKRAGLHYDLRLGDPSRDAHSWAIRKLPGPGETSYAAQTFTHAADYMNFAGTLKGYGAGTVKIHTRSKAYIHYAGHKRILFSVMQGRSTEDYALINVHDKGWIIHNMSAPTEKIPRGKVKYKEETFGLALIDKHPTAVVAAKLDGAHTKILMRPNRRARAFSHRVSEVGDKLEYTHKVPGMFDLKHKGTGETILTAELMAIGPLGPAPASRTTALLNATVLNSKEMQNSTGQVLTPFLFDIEKHNGVSTKELPFIERQKILRKFADKHPVFKLAPVAITRPEKEALIKAIADKTHPLTSEGIVLWEKTPVKAKIKQEHDVYIREIFPGGGKYSGKPANQAAGGFSYSWSKNGPIAGKVGTGFSDDLRRKLWKNKGQYTGKVARVTALGKYPSGALEKPSFSTWHVEKNIR
jgi:hypothetical protein